MNYKVRSCPLCKANPSGIVYPYSSKYNNIVFNYYKCSGCATVYVDPIPDDLSFRSIYAKAEYHDKYYNQQSTGDYNNSVQLLKKYIKPDSFVMDYGCGTGIFLKMLAIEGFIPFGVEYDKDAANLAAINGNCTVVTVPEYTELSNKPKYDVIHLGDVLEHLPDPDIIISKLLLDLKKGGYLFVEGPLEINSSIVYWSAKTYALIKRKIHGNTFTNDSPAHLFRTGSKQQFEYFKKYSNLKLQYWRVYETGWPYNIGIIKKSIAFVAKLMGGQNIFGIVFGNRFQAILKYQ